MLNCLSVSLFTLHNVILCQCQSVHATLCHTVSVYLRYIMSYCVSVSLSTLHNMLSYCLSVSLSMLHYVILSQCQSVHATSCNTASVFVFPRYIICCHTVSVSVYPWYTCILYCHTVSVCPRYIISRHTVSVLVFPRARYIIHCHTVSMLCNNIALSITIALRIFLWVCLSFPLFVYVPFENISHRGKLMLYYCSSVWRSNVKDRID